MGDITGVLFMLVPMFAIFYFLIWRPEQIKRKKHQAMLEKSDKGGRGGNKRRVARQKSSVWTKILSCFRLPKWEIRTSKSRSLAALLLS